MLEEEIQMVNEFGHIEYLLHPYVSYFGNTKGYDYIINKVI
jgi:hypothetical protein